MQPPQAHLLHEFGNFELDPTRRVLTSRTDGAPVDITARVLDALIYLAQRPGQLIEKRALIEALWPNVVVEDGNLSQTIHALRRVLGEKAGEHRYIATVPGRGYQFVAQVNSRAAVPATPVSEPATSRRPKWVVAGGVTLLLLGVIGVFLGRSGWQPDPVPAAAHPTIAVLPFVDMSEAQDQAHFADGLSEEILNLLAHADNLRVTARTSSFSFKGENVDIRTIAQRLDVSYVLEGSVRKAGDRLRITAQLIDAANSAHVWSDTFDRDVHDVFGVQREIAAAVAGALRVSLAHTGPKRAETTSTEAFEHYLQGRFLFNRRSTGDVAQAKTHFEEAVRIDPGYARAWSGLAGAYFVAKYERLDYPDAMQKWGEAAERAIALDPELPEAHIRAAQYYFEIGKQAAADEHIARAAALDPDDPMVISANMSEAIIDGRMADAIEMLKRVVASDPLSASNRSNLGLFLMTVDRLPEAQAELERALELSPAGPATTTVLADLALLQGRLDEALQIITRLPAGYIRDERLAIAHFARGNVREGDELLARLQTLAKQPGSDTRLPLAVAEVNAARREPDRAFEWLERAIPREGPQFEAKVCWLLLEEMQVSPYLKLLHSDPRWGELMARERARLR